MIERWDWDYAWEILPALLDGLWLTVRVVLLGLAIALVLGLMFTIMRRSTVRWVSVPTELVVEFIRSTPLLVQLFIFFYLLPQIGLGVSAFLTGAIGLGVHYATYTSEVYRAGIEGVPVGQWEAATALHLPRRRVWTSVVLPQAIPPSIPALGNYAIGMFKESPQLIVITLPEILTTARDVGSENFRYMEPFVIVGVLFLVVSVPTAWLVRVAERRTGATTTPTGGLSPAGS